MQIVRNEQLEKQIIASAIVSEKALDELAHRVKETDFTIEPLAKICGELHKCAQKGYKPEASLIAGRLGNEYFDIFGQLMTTVSTSNDIKDLVRKLKEVTQAREITSKAYNIVAMSQDITDHKDFTEHAISQFSDISIEHKDSNLTHISESFGDVINEIDRLERGEKTGILTGIADIDNQTNGIRRGEYVILAGRPSEGKTSLALSMIKNMALKGHKVGMFSLEMTKTELTFKLVSMLGTGEHVIPMTAFRGTSAITKKHLAVLPELLGALKNSNVYVNDSARSTMTDIEVELRRFVKSNGLDAVFIDYIGLVNSDAMNAKKRHELIQDFSMRFKNLFKELQVAGFVVVQMNRDSHNKKPNMSNLAESSQLERDAHLIYLIWQPDQQDKTKRVLICDKARSVAGGTFPMHFSTLTTEFRSMTIEESERYMKELNKDDEPKQKDYWSDV